eukprot:353082-Chlamydomonas_euryale.AAC.11
MECPSTLTSESDRCDSANNRISDARRCVCAHRRRTLSAWRGTRTRAAARDAGIPVPPGACLYGTCASGGNCT